MRWATGCISSLTGWMDAPITETTDPSKLNEIRRGHIVALEPAQRMEDQRISIFATSRMRPASIAGARIWK
jgi:hypothetical protein